MTSEVPSNWSDISDSLGGELPRSTYRAATVQILEKVTRLGPLGNPSEEFRRVYKFVHYHEPARVLRVVDELLEVLNRQAQPWIKNNAWRYVVGAFDSWICRARVFYLAAGIVEGALRSRLDEALTNAFGPEWPTVDDAVPSTIRDQLARDKVQQLLASTQRLLDEKLDDRATIEGIRRTLSDGAAQSAPISGSQFVSQLSFGLLRSFFQARKLWGGAPKLQLLFRSPGKGVEILRTEVDQVLGTIHELRNDVAHYRPGGKLSFMDGLFACATLARWLEVDLQHVYGAIDTRVSTELSHLLESHLGSSIRKAQLKRAGCYDDGCVLGEPLDLLLEKAPVAWPDTVSAESARLGCPYHRVKLRSSLHRPDD